MKDGLTLEGLKKLVDGGEIDTVVVAFPDHMGRLMGKRVVASYFLDHIAPDGMEACNYLFSVFFFTNCLTDEWNDIAVKSVFTRVVTTYHDNHAH